MATLLTKTVFVLDRQEDMEHNDATILIVFKREGYMVERVNKITLPRVLWEELGEPDKITVTVEPGDTLNVEEEA